MTKEERIVEDAPFDIPAFDEKEFIRKELISFKTTVVLFVLSILIAAGSYALERSRPTLPFVAHVALAVGVGVLLFRLLFRAAKIDIGHWKRKEWLGTSALYFFFWLGFFLLFLNPPFADAAAPRVELEASPGAQAAGNPIELGAYIADNVGLRTEALVFCVHPVAAAAVAPDHYGDLSDAERQRCGATWTREGDEPFWSTSVTPTSAGSYVVFVVAPDTDGRANETRRALFVGDPFRVVDPPRGGTFERHDDSFAVRVRDELVRNLRAVQYSTDAGQSWHNFRLHPDAEKAKEGWWVTDPSYAGWAKGPQQVLLRAVDHPTFLHREEFRVGGGVAVDPHGPWNVTVGTDLQGVGEKAEPAFAERRFAHPGQTPLPSLPLVVAALAGAALARRRSRDA